MKKIYFILCLLVFASLVTKAQVPNEPTNLVVTPITTGGMVQFTAPSDSGGSTITNYEYSTDGGANWVTPSPVITASPLIISSGLTNCTTYSIKLRAVNAAGSGSASAAASLTPTESVVPGINWTSRTSAADNSWYGVTYGNGVFVAVSGSGTGNRVMTSPDGITWTSRTSAANNFWNSVTYGNGLFVAVSESGTGNRVMTSPDGITWTSRTSAADNSWISVTYGNNLFVAVAYSGINNRVMTSPDGINWTTRTSASNNNWVSVTYGNGLFVAVAATGTNRVMTSPNGINWTTRTPAVDNGWNSVTYGNDLFVAVSSNGSGNRVMTSPNGITWTSRTSAAENSWNSVTYGNSLFVAVSSTGSGNRVMTSPDGIIWTSRTSAASNSWRNVTYGNGLFVASSTSGSSNRVMTSSFAVAADAPVIGSAAFGSSTTVNFTQSSSTLAPSISNYEYSTDNGSNWTATSPADSTSPLTITGLAAETNSIMIRAVNIVGSSCASNKFEALACLSTSSTETINACSSYTWHGSTYTSSNNTATWTGTNAAGCDSVVTLNLTITPQPAMPTLACYETATFNTTTCSWDVTGTPVLANAGGDASACGGSGSNYNLFYQNATGSGGTVSWSSTGNGWFQYLTGSGPYTDLSPIYHIGTTDLSNGSVTLTLTVTGANDCVATSSFTLSLAAPPVAVIDPSLVNPWDELHVCEGGSYSFSSAIVTPGSEISWSGGDGSFNNSGIQNPIYTPGPDDIQNGHVYINLNVNSNDGSTLCDNRVSVELIIDPVPAMPTLACYETASFNPTTCSWDITGTEPALPTLACYETATFNTTTCSWDITGTQPTMPTLACYETATFNTSTCTWVVTGSANEAIVTTTSSCNTYSWSANSSNYTQSGTYSYNANCQNYILNLTIKQSTTSTTNATATGNYSWNGNSYTSSGTYTYLTTNAAGCDSAALLSLTINAIVINNISNVCTYIGTNQTLTYTASVAGASSYAWTLPQNTQLVSGQGTRSVVIKLLNGFASQANKQIRVTPAGGSLQIIYLAAQSPVSPAAIIASTTNVCASIGNNVPVIYKIPKLLESGTTNATASSYLWSAQNGTTNITHPNGNGVNDTVVAVTFNANFSTSTITVQSVNACGVSGIRSYLITRNNPTVGIISGPTNSCEYIGATGTVANYSVAAIANVHSYTWTLPLGATDVNGQGTNTISFKYPVGFTGGSISVNGTNGCGTSSTRTLSISRLLPGTPGNIDVINTQTCLNRVYTYSIATLPRNATSVLWTVPSVGTLVNGQGTRSITVSYPNGVVDGAITVKGVSNCGTSGTKYSIVKLAPCPASPSTQYTKGVMSVTPSSMDVKVFPNPTTSSFNLQVTAGGIKSAIQTRVLDLQGRLMKTITIKSNENISLGAELKPGVYMLEVLQGVEKKVVRMVKY